MKGEKGAPWKLGIAVGAALTISMALVLAVPLAAAGASGSARSVGSVALVLPSHARPLTTCAAGANPEFVAFDPINKWFYVANVNGASVSVYKNTCTLAVTIALPAGAAPRGVAFSAGTGYIYVADAALNQVYVISGSTILQTVTSPTFNIPWAVAYDPATGYFGGGGSIGVTNWGNGSVSFIAQLTPSGSAFVFFVVGVGGEPSGIAYSPTYSAMLVTNQLDNNVTSFDATYLTIIDSSIPVGTSPFGIAYDPATLLTYVTNLGSNNVSVITALGAEWGSIGVGHEPIAVAFDGANLDLYVVNYLSHNVSVIGTAGTIGTVIKTIHLPTGSQPAGVAFDAAKNKMDVTGWGSATVYVVS